MKSRRIEELKMIPIFGETTFQLKRLDAVKGDNFHEWQDLEKAVYYQTARKLIEKEMEGLDRQADWERYRSLLRNRYETFLAQVNIEPRPAQRVHILMLLSTIAEHEEGEGEGVKYFKQAVEWVSKVPVESQAEIAEFLIDALEGNANGLAMMHLETIGSWDDGEMLKMAFQTLEAMVEENRIDELEFRELVVATEQHLRKSDRQEYVLRLVNQVVQLNKAHKANSETKEFFWRRAFQAGVDYQEPYTKMLMAVLLGDCMLKQKNWHATQFFLHAVDEVTDLYGEEGTFGGNFEQITEALKEMREAVKETGYDESLE